MGELLEEVRVQFRIRHFEQTRKYTSALDVAYEHIQQLEEKDKEEEDKLEVASEEITQEEAKHVSLSEEDEDETTPLRILIRK
jgi:hypothetical protein